MDELDIVKKYKLGKVQKEDLDKCSTCDITATVNDGLSKESKEQLKEMSGEEIVTRDIKKQMENERV